MDWGHYIERYERTKAYPAPHRVPLPRVKMLADASTEDPRSRFRDLEEAGKTDGKKGGLNATASCRGMTRQSIISPTLSKWRCGMCALAFASVCVWYVCIYIPMI